MMTIRNSQWIIVEYSLKKTKIVDEKSETLVHKNIYIFPDGTEPKVSSGLTERLYMLPCRMLTLGSVLTGRKLVPLKKVSFYTRLMSKSMRCMFKKYRKNDDRRWDE